MFTVPSDILQVTHNRCCQGFTDDELKMCEEYTFDFHNLIRLGVPSVVCFNIGALYVQIFTSLIGCSSSFIHNGTLTSM